MTGSDSAEQSDSTSGPAPRRSRAVRITLAVVAVVSFAVLTALGTWQVQRLFWKHDLIARVTQRVHAAPVAAPLPERWPRITRQDDEYRHVRVRGTFLPRAATLVQAVTELGNGYWLLVPLRQDDGTVVLVNRGFVAAGNAPRLGSGVVLPMSAGAPAQADVTGLLRISEPGGGFLRQNDPGAGRWYSRDVQAIAAVHGLQRVAPFFVDADADVNVAPLAGALPASLAQPVGGLTVVAFSDNHLVYALTWYALALMVAAAAIWIGRQERGQRRDRRTGTGADG
ncbi:MAG: SURF1 family protein [Herminiimonas sp.]|nr:SURF1 family protein [Herminiimonas sp.]